MTAADHPRSYAKPLEVTRSWKSAAASVLILVATLSVYNLPHRRGKNADSMDTRLIPILLLTQGNLYFDNYIPALKRKFAHIADRLYVVPSGRHYVSFFPVAPGLLLTPFYAPFVAAAKRHNPTPDDWLSFADRAEAVASVFIASACVLVLYGVVILLGNSTGVATTLALVYAFATNVFATFARSLLQHGFTALFMLLAIHGVLVCLRNSNRWRFVAPGICAGLAAACRPTSIVFAVLLAVWLGLCRKESLVPVGVGIALVLVPLAGYNYLTYHSWFGAYRLFLLPRPEALSRTNVLFALLVSPGRGLFVYFPLALMALWGFYLAQKHRDKWIIFYRALGAYAVAHVLIVWFVRWNDWTGGNCWGPRYLSESEYAYVILLAPALAYTPRMAGYLTFGVLALMSIFMQAVGVYARADWNFWPALITHTPARAWSITDNPVSRALASRFELNWTLGYPMFRNKPLRVTAANPPRMIKLSDGTHVLLAEMPSEMEFAIPEGASKVCGRFGFAPRAYLWGHRTAGAEFHVISANGNEHIELYSRFLDPVNSLQDRGLQHFCTDLPARGGGRLLFRIDPRANNDSAFGFTVWTDIAIDADADATD